MEKIEIWKDVLDYEGYYQVSNFGRVKSLERRVKWKASFTTVREKVLKNRIDKHGYYFVLLCKNKTYINRTVHQLVAEAFLNHKPCGYKLVVNHKNFIVTDNNPDNLEIITQRENSNRKHLKSSSKYIGVSWHKSAKKWEACAYFGKKIYIGLFNTENEAYQAYKEKIKTLNL